MIAGVAQKHPTTNSYSHVDLRRHSSAHPPATSPPVSRNGSTASTKSQPAWMSSIQERDRQGSSQSTPEPYSSGLKGLFGRKKAEKKQEKIVILSKHAALVKNNLRADPRGARKHPSPSVKAADVQGTLKSAHLTAEQQEMRHPHSGPPTLRGTTELPMLTRIVSGDEDDEWNHERARADWDNRKLPEVEKVLETHGEEERVTDTEVGGLNNLQLRRRSLLDVEIKGGEGMKPARRKTVFGGWAKDSEGVWHRG